jgi:hypothetical protein
MTRESVVITDHSCQFNWSNEALATEIDPHSPAGLLRQVAYGEQFSQDCAWLELRQNYRHLIDLFLPCLLDMIESSTVTNKGYLLHILTTYFPEAVSHSEESVVLAATVSTLPREIVLRAIVAVRECLCHQAPTVRSGAALALGHLLGSAVIPEIEEHLKHETDIGTISACVQALGRLVAPPIISASLSDEQLNLLFQTMITAAESHDDKLMITCFRCIHILGNVIVEKAIRAWIQRAHDLPAHELGDFLHCLMLFAFFKSRYPVRAVEMTAYQCLVLGLLVSKSDAWSASVLNLNHKQSDDSPHVPTHQSSVSWQLAQMGLPCEGPELASWVSMNQLTINRRA